jgi:uncharacterized protein
MSTPGFWDASALVPLCLRQGASSKVQRYLEIHPIVVWWSTEVEIRGAFARERRMENISAADQDWAVARLQLLKAHWAEILPSDDIRASAIGLLEKHPLRSADSLQLAAALAWSQGRPANRLFLCADQRLNAAAGVEGFTVLSTNTEESRTKRRG